jgi:hypothetical protein
LKALKTGRIADMKTSQTLPENYSFDSKFDLRNKKLLLWLNVAGLVLTIFFLFLFGEITTWLRGDLEKGILFSVNGPGDILLKLAGIILIVMLVMVLHEGVHGFFFWLFTKHKPVFGIKFGYAYAAMPDWYFQRNQYLVIGLAPFVILDLLGIFLIPIVPVNWLWVVLGALLMNSSGAVGDLAVVFWLLHKPAASLAMDKADSIELYTPM